MFDVAKKAELLLKPLTLSLSLLPSLPAEVLAAAVWVDVSVT